MFIVLSLFLLFVLPEESNQFTITKRIINGSLATPDEIKYIVSIQDFGQHVCGGSIIASTYILTAAHCLVGWTAAYTMPYLSVEYGNTKLYKGKSVGAKKATIHENYEPSQHWKNDIGLIQLKEPIPFGESVSAIPLPKKREAPPFGETAVLAGWGYTTNDESKEKIADHLHVVSLTVFTDKVCKQNDTGFNPKYQLCAGVLGGGKGQCTYDSGGPLVANGKQIGLVSWSFKPCGEPDRPGIYTRVANYIDWINKHK